jgi:hypothetical protein
MWRIVGVATGVTPGRYGDSITVGQFTVDVAGRVTDAANIPIRDATVFVPGIVQLNDTTTSISSTQALTAKAGKSLQDQIGNLADCTVQDRVNVVAALNDLQAQTSQLQTDALIWCGYYNAAEGDISYVSITGQRLGYQIGQELPAPGPKNGGDFFIVTVAGNPYIAGDYNAPDVNIEVGNWIVSETSRWSEVNAASELQAKDIKYIPSAPLTATNVQNALFQVTQLFRTPIGGASISETKPNNPYPGQLWWDSDDGLFYIFYQDLNGSQWVETGGGGSNLLGGGSGGIYLLDTGVGLTGGPITTRGEISLVPAFLDPADIGNSTIGGVVPGIGLNYENDTGVFSVRLTSDPQGTDETVALNQVGANILNNKIDALTGSNILAGTYDARQGVVVYATPAGVSKGLVVGQNLPAPSAALDNYYVIVTVGGDQGPNGPQKAGAGDWYICQSDQVPAVWFLIDFENIGAQAENVSVTEIPGIEFVSNVQRALEAIELQVQDRIEFVKTTSGGIQVDVTAPGLTSYDGTTLSIGLDNATLANRGIVQLTNDITGNSEDLAITQLAVSRLNTKVDALTGANILAGTYNSNTGTVSAVTPAGTAAGLVPGQQAPPAGRVPDNYYLIVIVGGGFGPPGAVIPATGVQSGDWFIVENEGGVAAWITIDYENRVVDATQVNVSPIPGLTATNVQTALEQIEAQVDQCITDINSSNNGISITTLPNSATFGNNVGLTLNPANSTDIGGVFVTPNNGLVLAPAGGLAAAIASNSVLGSVKIGAGISVDLTGTISVDIPDVGVSKISSSPGVSVEPTTGVGDVTIGITPATTGQIGGVKVGSGVNVTADGTIGIVPATAGEIGGVKVGSGINVTTDGTIGIVPATAGQIGGVKVGSGISVTADGTISTIPAVPPQKLDSLKTQFDGSRVSYTLAIGGTAVTPANDAAVLIVLGGVVQTAGDAYSVAGSTITFTGPPAVNTEFYGVLF